VQYSLDILGFDHDDIVAIIDSDMFLVKEFSIAEYLSGYDIAGQPQSRADVHYLWNGIMFFNMNTLPNKKTINCNCGIINNQGCDVGGYLYYYFKENPSIKIKYVNHYYIESNNTEYFIDKTFFHYRGGGNWDHQSRAYHKQKTKFLHDFINNVLAQ
jgi:hypothetical protein